MSQRNTNRVTVSAFALTMVCLFSVAITAQKVPQGTASTVKPVKGIDVIVQKNPGNTAMRTVTTDGDGKFTFPVLDAGSYSMKLYVGNLRLSKNGDATIKANDPLFNLKSEDLKTCVLTIRGAEGGPKEIGWDFETKKTLNPDQSATAKSTPGEESIDVVSDGVNPIHGIVQTSISKSRSNVKTN